MKTQGFISGNMNNSWHKPEGLQAIGEIFQSSFEKPQLFFKHSTRCSISIMVLSRFEKNWNNTTEACSLFLIDVLDQRPVSNYLSELTKTEHQSPQVLLIYKEKLLYIASHTAIDVEDINRQLQEIK
jgi:bacillithiol system protein YtxJ